MNPSRKSGLRLITEDGVLLNASHFQKSTHSSTHTCIVVVPGFAQHSGTQTMSKIGELIASHADVLCIDLRGTGNSAGEFHFGGKEHLDVKAAVQWAERTYENVYLLGLSLGAYSALRATASFEHHLRHLFLISCPTSVDEIILQGWVLKHALQQISKTDWMTRDRSLLFKWRFPLSKKPSAAALATRLRTPVSFLVGGQDLLVPKKMSEQVYHGIPGPAKTWLEIPNGHHAEELIFSFQAEFEKWLNEGLNSQSI